MSFDSACGILTISRKYLVERGGDTEPLEIFIPISFV